jgi:hypothetical protein
MLHTIHECCFKLALLDTLYQKTVSEVMFWNCYSMIHWYPDSDINQSYKSYAINENLYMTCMFRLHESDDMSKAYYCIYARPSWYLEQREKQEARTIRIKHLTNFTSKKVCRMETGLAIAGKICWRVTCHGRTSHISNNLSYPHPLKESLDYRLLTHTTEKFLIPW